MKTPFLTPRLDGYRFSEHSVPLEVLKDWAAFEELIVEVARSLYLKDHQDRQRVPRGFADSFALHLSGVGQGSAKPILERVSPNGELHFEDDYFDRARNLVLAVIAAVALHQAIPADFPRELLGYFDQFGRSMRDDEKVEFAIEGQPTAIVYDRAVRKKLILSTGATEYRSTAELRGRVSEVNTEKRSYTLKLANGEHIPAIYTSELRKAVLTALDKFEANKVLVKGLTVFDTGDRPRKIEHTTHIEILDPNDVPARLEELAQLKNGWLNGAGVAPSAAGLKWLSDTWVNSCPDDVLDPFVYPTPEGNAQLEWTVGAWEISAEIDLASHQAFLVGVKVDSAHDAEESVDLNTPQGWSKLANFVRSRA